MYFYFLLLEEWELTAECKKKCYLIIAADHPLGFLFEHTEVFDHLFLIQVRCYSNETKEMFLKRQPISDTEWMVLQWFYICVKCLPEYCWSMFLHIADITVPVQEKVWSSLSDRLLVYYRNYSCFMLFCFVFAFFVLSLLDNGFVWLLAASVSFFFFFGAVCYVWVLQCSLDLFT